MRNMSGSFLELSCLLGRWAVLPLFNFPFPEESREKLQLLSVLGRGITLLRNTAHNVVTQRLSGEGECTSICVRASCIILREILLSGSFSMDVKGPKGYSQQILQICLSKIDSDFLLMFLPKIPILKVLKAVFPRLSRSQGSRCCLSSAYQMYLHVWVKYEGRQSMGPLFSWLRLEQSCDSGASSFLI